MKKLTLASYLVSSGLCYDQKAATALVLAGKALVNDQPGYAGQQLKATDQVRIKGDSLPFAGKGGIKLASALEAFQLDISGQVCLDAGASTGGFTDCLLQQGAKMVYAVEVGFGQLDSRLRQDPRVINLERTNLGDSSLLALSPRPEFATCDVSYLSLRDAVPLYQAIVHGKGQLLALVKPLFEVADNKARRSGIIPETAYAPLLADLTQHFNQTPGVVVAGLCESPIRGNAGTLEFFLHLVFGQDTPAPDMTPSIQDSVERALNLLPYRKPDKELL